MKNIFILLFIFAALCSCYSQINYKLFERFSGKWEGVYETGGYKNREVMENSFIHKKMFFEMNISGQMEGNSAYKYTSSAVFAVNDDEEIIGWGFDESGYKGMVEYKGRIEEDKVLLKGKSREYTIEVTYEIKDNSLVRKSRWIFKDSPENPSIVECVYKRL